MAWTWILPAFLVLGAAAAAAILYGLGRWDSGTRELRGRLEAARIGIVPEAFDPREAEGLPLPVRRYFETVLKAGQPMIEAASVEQEGTFNMSEAGENWKPFTSAQRIVTKRAGFLWDARIAMLPGFPARVHDAYIDGEGI